MSRRPSFAPIDRRSRVLITLGFLCVAVAVALIRFRMSPLYPGHNDINSDFYVYQVVGNSWTYGQWPYRDVFDVKGPSLFLLFGGFSALRPWSTAPPLIILAGLANISLWLSYAIARRSLRTLPAAAVSATAVIVIYLSAEGIPTSFSCEELAVPGVLLLLWLLLRWLHAEPVSGWWWILDGAVFAALFWAKYQVVAPWVAALISMALIGSRHGISRREIVRVLAAHFVGAVCVTVAVLVVYLPVLPDMLFAYFRASRPEGSLWREPANELAYAGNLIEASPVTAFVLVGCIGVFAAVRWRQRDGVSGVILLAAILSTWASTAIVRHPMNVIVPLSFVAVALPLLIRSIPIRPAFTTAAAVLLTVAGVIPAMQESVRDYGLTRPDRSVPCRELPSQKAIRSSSVTAAFVDAAGTGRIMSVGTLFAARSLAATRTVPTMRFPYSYVAWMKPTGADQAQQAALEHRDVAYVWVSAPRFNLRKPIAPQLVAHADPDGPTTPGQANALARNYVPVLACQGQMMMRAK